MNERIRELALQAELPLLDADGKCKYGDTYFSKEKFAELMVKDFQTILRDNRGADTGTLSYRVEEHFGGKR